MKKIKEMLKTTTWFEAQTEELCSEEFTEETMLVCSENYHDNPKDVFETKLDHELLLEACRATVNNQEYTLAFKVRELMAIVKDYVGSREET